jgi:GNAT superfamily N-acetyltransferase
VELRRTRAADLPRTFDIFNAAIGDLFRRHGFDPPAPPLEVFAAQQRHLLEHDAERCWVAERDGESLGFASAWARGDSWFLASLFVHPRAQARGLGRALLDRVWGEGYAHRRTITDAIQPVSNAVYARRGLIPVAPVLAFDGVPAADAPPTLAPVEPTAEALRALDLSAYGFDRAVDHALWTRVGHATVWLRSGTPVAYSYVFPGGAVGPIAAVDGAAAAAALTAEFARADGPVRVRMPGTARELVAAALASGLRLSATPGLLLLSPGTPAPRALAIGSYPLL